MELSLNALVERLDDQFSQRATRAWRIASGTEPDLAPIPEMSELVRIDAFQAVSEVVASPRVDEAKRARLQLLKRHVARAHVEAHAAQAADAERRMLTTHTFVASGRSWTLREAARELPRLVSREGRVAVGHALSAELMASDAPAARRFDAELEGIAALQLTPVTFLELLHGRAPGPRLDAAAALLATTKDPHLDLLGYGLKKLDPLLTPRLAKAADAERAALAPWVFEHFRREDLVHAVSRCIGDLGLSQNAEGRITVDTEPRPLREPAAVVEIKVPDQVRLLLTPDLGVDTYASWLFHWGVALHRANVGRTLPFVERRLGDRAVVDAVGLLFESFLLEEGWLKRYLRLTQNQARESVRAAAFRQLQAMRVLAARAGYAFDASGRGSTEALRDEYASRMQAALQVEVAPGAARFEASAMGDSLLRLDAWALETLMRRTLRERFNEDFWRNPATGRWLVDLASRGQRDDAQAVAAALGSPDGALPVGEAAAERVRVMGA